MIRLERCCGTAIRTSFSVLRDERAPLGRREAADGALLTGSSIAADRQANFRMCGGIASTSRIGELGMRIIPGITGAPVLLRMGGSPAPHRLARLLCVLPHPLAPIRAPAFGIFVWHARSLSSHTRAYQVSIGPIKKPGSRARAFCCGGRIRTFGLWVMSPTSYRCSTPRCESILPRRHRASALIAVRRTTRSIARHVALAELPGRRRYAPLRRAAPR